MSKATESILALTRGIEAHRPRRLPGRRWLHRAVVAVVLCDDSKLGPCVLLMRRAERRGDPWSGHMSFPGGRMDSDDRNSLAAAMREAREETGLRLAESDCIGRLSDVVTRRHEKPLPMIVSPYVFRLVDEPTWVLNAEAVETFWVPLSFLADQRNRQPLIWRQAGINWRMPSYVYEGRRIWGLTLLMLRELMRIYRRTQDQKSDSGTRLKKKTKESRR